uniref:Uncharacterized protein n=1 Tax=Setaria viridis TaxID=4556 RepID=A0A4V6DCC7_SETVI|nr:hypothetical protein SEVIR_1G037650v2 [Setaria viridis]
MWLVLSMRQGPRVGWLLWRKCSQQPLHPMDPSLGGQCNGPVFSQPSCLGGFMIWLGKGSKLTKASRKCMLGKLLGWSLILLR